MTPRMRVGDGGEKPLEISKLRNKIKKGCLFTCKSSRSRYGHDVGACESINLGKSLEKEPVICHCIGQPRCGEMTPRSLERKVGTRKMMWRSRAPRASVSSYTQGKVSISYVS